jgi:hypothetical protein
LNEIAKNKKNNKNYDNNNNNIESTAVVVEAVPVNTNEI